MSTLEQRLSVGRCASGVAPFQVQLTHVPAPDFDLVKTLDCGQVFHWRQSGDGFVGTIGDDAFYVEQRGASLQFTNGLDESDRLKRSNLPVLVERYFALDHPLQRICDSFPRDPVMAAAKDFCRGLRIIRQPKWECVASFICSSMKQVAHIKQISLALRKRFGEPRAVGASVVYTFPAAEQLAATSEAELRACALGYRAKNLLATARLVASGAVDLEELTPLPDPELRERLCQLPGVGVKVANCVMLFAYERLRAFPIDVWIERVLRETYFPRARKLNAARLRAFTDKYFGEHGGYAQQYLFHHARTRKRNGATGSARSGRPNPAPPSGKQRCRKRRSSLGRGNLSRLSA